MARILAILGAGLLVVSTILMLALAGGNKGNGVMTVAFLDVGQGDAIYVESPTGEQMLVDGGADRQVLSRLSEVMPWLDRSIDVIVATHPDQDHIGGLVPVLDTYRVGQVLTSGSTSETGIFEVLQDRTVTEGAQVELIRRGSLINLGAVQVEVLFPEQVFDVSDRNVNSIVLLVTYGEHEFLLTGDIGVEQEQYLTALYGKNLQSDVLKLSHHGGNTSSDLEFLETVAPSVAIVSAGRNNKYGHPTPEVISRVESLDIPILTTQSGNIVFVSDGNILQQQ